MPAPLAMRTCLPTLRAATVCCAECLSGDHGHRPTAHAWTANSGGNDPGTPRVPVDNVKQFSCLDLSVW